MERKRERNRQINIEYEEDPKNEVLKHLCAPWRRPSCPVALQLVKICMHPSLGYTVHGTARVPPLQSAPGHGWHGAGIA